MYIIVHIIQMIIVLAENQKAGMILQSLNDFEINLNNSWLIGDKMSDIECAKNGNIPNRILISEDVVDGKDFLLAKSLLDSVKYKKVGKYEI